MSNAQRAAAPSIEVRQAGRHLAAEIHGADLTRPLADEEFAVIHQAFCEHGLLIFPELDITVEQQRDFAARFGELSVHPFSPNKADAPELIILDNDGNAPPFLTDVWHSDETFRETPPLGTFLRARVVPPVGGDTMFASMAAAFDGLSDRMQHFISGLEAIHDFKPFRQLFGGDAKSRERLRAIEDQYPLQVHPVVRLHPVTGRKVIFVNEQFTLAIKDMRPDESRAILDYLFQQPKVPEYQYRVHWKPGTMICWDNRTVQHYAIHDYLPHRRAMERFTVKGDRPVGPPDLMPSPATKRHASESGVAARSAEGGTARQVQRAY